MNKKLDPKLADTFVSEILHNTSETLLVKAKEYVRNNDSMHNFNEASKLKGITREEAIENFRLKHVISVNDIRNDVKKGILPSEDVIYEKFGDIINYYILEAVSLLHRSHEKSKE